MSVKADQCLGPFGLLEQNTIDWVAYKQQKFISHSLKVENSKIKALILFTRAPSSCLGISRRSRLLIPLSLGLGCQLNNFGEHKHLVHGPHALTCPDWPQVILKGCVFVIKESSRGWECM